MLAVKLSGSAHAHIPLLFLISFFNPKQQVMARFQNPSSAPLHTISYPSDDLAATSIEKCLTRPIFQTAKTLVNLKNSNRLAVSPPRKPSKLSPLLHSHKEYKRMGRKRLPRCPTLERIKTKNCFIQGVPCTPPSSPRSCSTPPSLDIDVSMKKNFSIHPEILTVHDVDGARILASMTSISRMTGNGISSIQDSNWQNQLNVRCEGACILFFPSLTIHLRAQNSLPWFCTNFQAPTKIGQQLGGTSQPTSPKTGQHSSSSAHSTMAHHYELWVIQLKQ